MSPIVFAAALGCGGDDVAPVENPPPRPSLLETTVPGSLTVSLRWTPSDAADFSSYLLQRNTAGLPTFATSPSLETVLPSDPRLAWTDLAAIQERTTATWVDAYVSPSHAYDYRLITFDEAGQSATSDSVPVITQSIRVPTIGLEPRVSFRDRYEGPIEVWLVGASPSLEASDIVFEVSLPESASALHCDVRDRPLPNWLGLCVPESGNIALAMSRLPKGQALSESGTLATFDAMISRKGRVTPHSIEVLSSDGLAIFDSLTVLGMSFSTGVQP